MVLNDLVLPYTWYNVQVINKSFVLVEGSSTHAITLEEGALTTFGR